jgi:hypothetical protein
VLEGPKERAIAAAGLLAWAALVGSLFLTWYQVVNTTVTDSSGGFAGVFSGGSSDAWDTISNTSFLLTACAVVGAGLLVLRLAGRSRVAAGAAVCFALIAGGVTIYRMVAAPETPRHGVEGAYFERSNSTTATGARSVSSVIPTSDASDGAVVAVCAALIASIAGCALTLAPRPTT